MRRMMSAGIFVAAMVVIASLSSACHKRAAAVVASKPQATTATHAAPATATGTHDPEHDLASGPPIDCPLRKHGIDPTHMRPFADVEKYIAFLERESRAKWQKPDEIVAALHLKGTETIFDLGAGSGYFTFRFAKALPDGKVVAADTEPEMIRHIHHKAMTEGIRNVHATIIKTDDPGVTADADVVFLCDVLHHVADKAAWLKKLTTEMKAGARLVLIEFKEGKLPEGPPESAKIGHDQLLASVTKAGLKLVSDEARMLPYQTFMIFRKPG
jgi:ubiquinone/menaquinone biosynthesis C-methylase UbiE